jgi:hypothetical protein
MSETIDALLFDMLAWLAPGPRPYTEVMDAWRTSCPRLTVWEDAVERGLVEQVRADGVRLVRIAPAGLAFLAERGVRLSPARAAIASCERAS